MSSDWLISSLGYGLSDGFNVLRAASCLGSTSSILLFRLRNSWVYGIEPFDDPVKCQLSRNIEWRNIKLLSKLSSDCLHSLNGTIPEDDPSLLLHCEGRWQRHDDEEVQIAKINPLSTPRQPFSTKCQAICEIFANFHKYFWLQLLKYFSFSRVKYFLPLKCICLKKLSLKFHANWTKNDWVMSI